MQYAAKKFTVPKDTYRRRCCSSECSRKLISVNNHLRAERSGYAKEVEDRKARVKQDKLLGYTNSSQRPKVRAKISKSMKGVSHKQTEEIKLKISQALKAANNSKENKVKIIEKRTKTVQNKYGVDNVSQLESSKLKSKYTNLSRYGVEYAAQKQEIAYKANAHRQATMIQKYGVDSPMKVEEFRHEHAVTMHQKSNQDTSNYVSELNKSFRNYLNQNSIDSKYEFPLEGYNFDLHIIDTNILLELDPSASHSIVSTKFESIDKNYHLMKSELAKKHEFHCIHVFDWDDWNKILMLLQPKKVIYARKCKVVEIDQHTADIFTDKYHIQGKCNGQKLNAGLYYRGELIEVMTFGKPRYAKKYD